MAWLHYEETAQQRKHLTLIALFFIESFQLLFYSFILLALFSFRWQTLLTLLRKVSFNFRIKFSSTTLFIFQVSIELKLSSASWSYCIWKKSSSCWILGEVCIFCIQPMLWGHFLRKESIVACFSPSVSYLIL